jgi:serine/threonine protein phosphatase PrpC
MTASGGSEQVMFCINKLGKKIHILKIRQQSVAVDFGDMKVSYMTGNAQHIGKRKTQEDYFGFSDLSSSEKKSRKGICAVLADGMGGLSNGRQISEYVVSSTLALFDNLDYTLSICTQLKAIINKINEQVCREFSQDGKSKAGSTFSTVVLYKDKLFWACVGDSRIYLFRNGYLYQLNEDHDYKNKLLKDYINGTGRLDAAHDDPQKDSLTSFIGNPDMQFIDANRLSFSLQKDDKIMLCSDGIYNALSDFELIKRLKEQPQLACEKIAQDVLNKKISSQDNLTVMIINFN